MRLAFLCGALEPGRDGVGDYARRLAGQCIRQGHACALVSLADSHITEIQSAPQEIEGTPIPALRLPALLPWKTRTIRAHEQLAAFKPDWTSFQFVPFAFHAKGLCFGLGKYLEEINGAAAWHVMFHELWLGLGQNSPAKDRIYGALQRRIVLDLNTRLRPRVVHTQADPYRRVLARDHIQASILPLISNIPQIHQDGWDGLLEPLVSGAMGEQAERSTLYLAGILGGVHPEWNAAAPVDALLPLVRRAQKRLVLVFHGKNNLSPEAFDTMKAALQGRAHVVVAGQRSDAEISRILNTLDFGLATSPRQIIQKSGSVAAMLEHGLTVLMTRNDWRLREQNPPPDASFPRLLTPEQLAGLGTLPARDRTPQDGHSVQRVAGRFLDALKASVPAGKTAMACAC